MVPTFAATMRRARKDPIARLLAAATTCGVRFRLAGADLEVDGAGALHPDDRASLRQHIEDVRARLEPPSPATGLLTTLDVVVEVITTEVRACEALAGLSGPLGFDIETMPRATGNGVARPWIRITRDGRRAVHQPTSKDKAALDPQRARPRLAQIYDSASATVYIIDLAHVPIEALRPLEHKQLIVHNSAFEHAMLAAQGIHLRRTWCTLLLARLALGAERGGLRLAEVAHAFLDGLELPKDEQVSDWAAERLSYSQLEYAALDAVVAHRLADRIWADLDDGARAAFRISNATVPAVAAMRLAGIPFDRAVHEATIAAWEVAYAEARAQFVAITGHEIPPAGAQRSAWLEQRMPADMLSWWPRTETGQLSLRKQHLELLGAVPEVRPLLEVVHWDKRLRAFGRTLLDKVGADGRLCMDLKPAWTKTGRCSCSAPNLQQLPQDVRCAVVAPPGRTLIIADYSQIELRAAAELSGDEAMRQVFRDGVDMHRLNAAAFTGKEDVSDEERSKSKRVGFGTLYGSGPRGLVASAWSMYRIEMTEAEAQAYKDAFYARYPALRTWQSWTADAARATGVLRSVVGRPLRVEWEGGELKWTLCCNYPVQSSAADVMQLAMAKVHAALEGSSARLVLQIHDELVVEAPADIASGIEALVRQHMTAAYQELFPDAPINGLVDIAIRPCWAKPDTALPQVQPSRRRLRPVPVVVPPVQAAGTPRRTPPVTVSRPPDAGVEALCDYMNERQRIHLRRQGGDSPPWTDDPILREHKFCCVHREDDKTTIWLREHWRLPYADHANLAFAMAMACLINRPDTLAEVGFPTTWAPGRVLAMLRARQARGESVFSDAYKTGMGGIVAGESRIDRVVEALELLHRDPPPLEQAHTLEAAFDMLKDRPGIGPFVAYEAVTDLRWTRYLRDAPDIMTWANAGPGAVRGLNRTWSRPVEQALRPAQALAEMRLLLEIAPQYLGAHVPVLEMRDIETNLCELDKYDRIRRGQGTGRRYRPPPAGAEVMAVADPTLPPEQTEPAPSRPPRRRLSPEQRHRLKLEIAAAAATGEDDDSPAAVLEGRKLQSDRAHSNSGL